MRLILNEVIKNHFLKNCRLSDQKQLQFEKSQNMSILWKSLIFGSSVRIFCSVIHFCLISSFVQSRPPGRKMVLQFNIFSHRNLFNLHFQVTSDINVAAHFFGDFAIISSCIEMILRALLGPLSFYTIFFFNQVYKFGLRLLQGTLNVSAFLQIAIITNQL